MVYTSQIGLFQVKLVLQTKYDFNISEEDFTIIIRRLTNQLWKLIPMRENNEDWRKQLNTVLIEIAGLNELLISPLFLQLMSKLEGMCVIDIDFDLYRKTVFECISLLQEVSRGVRL